MCLTSFAGLHLDLRVSHSRGEKSGWQRSGNEACAFPHKSLSAEIVNYVIAKGRNNQVVYDIVIHVDSTVSL